MTPQEYRQAIKQLDLTQKLASELLGVNPRTSRRWIAGDSEIPKSVELLLEILLKQIGEEQ